MMRKRFYSALLFLLVCMACSTPETSTLTVKFKDKKYDQLWLRMVTDENVINMFKGVTVDSATWLFSVPDTLLLKQQYVSLYTEFSDTLIASLLFIFPNGADSIRIGSHRIKQGDLFELEYLRSFYEENVDFYEGRNAREDTFLITGSVNFETYGAGAGAGGKAYNLFKKGEVTSSIELIQKHPSSVSLMCELYAFAFRFEKEQLRKIYDSFDASAQQSYWGKKVAELLRMPLPDNPTLRNLGNGRQEPMIIDSAKYNMVIFSASWCGWCHLQIPLLKQVYADLHGKGLEMTYITVDKERDLEAWNKVMEEYGVPWRSLWGGKETKLITYKFGITGYPQAILFHPDGTSERIDVRKDDEKEKLYRLLDRENILKNK